jgi:hypothetical protein
VIDSYNILKEQNGVSLRASGFGKRNEGDDGGRKSERAEEERFYATSGDSGIEQSLLPTQKSLSHQNDTVPKTHSFESYPIYVILAMT